MAPLSGETLRSGESDAIWSRRDIDSVASTSDVLCVGRNRITAPAKEYNAAGNLIARERLGTENVPNNRQPQRVIDIAFSPLGRRSISPIVNPAYSGVRRGITLDYRNELFALPAEHLFYISCCAEYRVLTENSAGAHSAEAVIRRAHFDIITHSTRQRHVLRCELDDSLVSTRPARVSPHHCAGARLHRQARGNVRRCNGAKRERAAQ